MKIKAQMKTFLLGAAVYPLLEFLYRGRSHPSMALAGGLGLALLKKCRGCRLCWPLRGLLGALCITGIEYAAGLIFNRRHHIWDYRGQRGHLQGQICPAFFGVWLLFSLFITWNGRKKRRHAPAFSSRGCSSFRR